MIQQLQCNKNIIFAIQYEHLGPFFLLQFALFMWRVNNMRKGMTIKKITKTFQPSESNGYPIVAATLACYIRK